MKKRIIIYPNRIKGFAILIIFAVINSSAFAQKASLIKSIKSDTILKKEAIINKKKKNTLIEFNGNDGPFIINDSLLYVVDEANHLKITTVFDKDSIPVEVSNLNKTEFFVSLASGYDIPDSEYELPEKIVAISDIEGNFNAFSSFLYSNKIIDKNYDWIFGEGHLVLNGDFVDRGKNVTQVLWLIYKLDQQAKAQNGQVHFILGNHEILNFYGDYRYNNGKYIKAAQVISNKNNNEEALRFLYSENSEIGKWLATKNVIEKIGDYIFTHAGLSPDILKYDLNIKDINKLVRKNYNNLVKIEDKTERFLYSSDGPFWYRGLAREKLKSQELDEILEEFKAKKIIIGHTPVDSISSKYEGKLINIDVHHGQQMFSGKTYGLLIENCEEFIIDDTNKIKALNKD
ncbi:metallophosphoesterase [Winogradskyella litorisediminis]|uniref:Metallophosphoesterase n=1 Tax=Winogradskyella litorisediminis TaxID=1156618 RepID=A0ABW3N7M6_9FLAO